MIDIEEALLRTRISISKTQNEVDNLYAREMKQFIEQQQAEIERLSKKPILVMKDTELEQGYKTEIDKLNHLLSNQQTENKDLQKRVHSKTKCLIRCRKRRDSVEQKYYLNKFKINKGVIEMINIDEVKIRINCQIEDCKDINEDLDDCDWNCQKGVIVSANQAESLLKALEQLQAENKKIRQTNKDLLNEHIKETTMLRNNMDDLSHCIKMDESEISELNNDIKQLKKDNEQFKAIIYPLVMHLHEAINFASDVNSNFDYLNAGLVTDRARKLLSQQESE